MSESNGEVTEYSLYREKYRNKPGWVCRDGAGNKMFSTGRSEGVAKWMFEKQIGLDPETHLTIVDGDYDGLDKNNTKAIIAKNPLNKFSIADRYKFLFQYTTMVINSIVPSMIVTGNPGFSKTFRTFRTIKEAGLKKDIDYHVVKGYSTAKSLYRVMYDFRTRLLIFDDCDSILLSATASNLLKAGLDSHEPRTLSWRSEKPNPDLPPEFDFEGRIIFISNLTRDRLNEAVISRSIFVDLTFYKVEEKLEYIDMVSKEMEGDKKLIKECMDLIKDVTVAENCGNWVNVRSLIRVLKIREAFKDDWKGLAEYTVINQ